MSNIINLGPVAVYHTTAGTGANPVIMPPTQGGASLDSSFELVDTLADVTGTFPRDSYFTGGAFSVTVNYTEMTREEILSLFPVTEDNAVVIPVGCSAQDYQIGLLLRPIICGSISTDDDQAFFAPYVLPVPQFNVTLGLEQRIWTVEYRAYPADPRNYDFRLFYFGMPTGS